MKCFNFLNKLRWVICLAAIAPGFANAASDYNIQIDRLGIQGTSDSFVYYFGWMPATPLSVNCAWSVVYIDSKSASAKSMYTQLLAMKMAGKKISRLEYSVVNGDQCYASLIEFKD